MHPIRREIGELAALAGPIVGAQLAFMGMGVADTLMAGRLGAQDLAAVAVGANLWMVLFVWFMGVCMAVSPVIAQRLGARANPQQLATVIQYGMLIALAMGAIWWLALRLVPPLVVPLLELEASTTALAIRYLHAASWGAPVFAVGFVLRYAMEGQGRSRPVLFAGIVGLIVNVLGDYLLMFGIGPFPRLGAEGCGWATACAALAMLLCMMVQHARLPSLRAAQPWRRWIGGEPKLPMELLRLGVPIGLIWLAEVALFAGAGLAMALFGDGPVGAHQIAINIAAVAFMVPMGLGLAATARIGQAAGAGDMQAVRLRGVVAIGAAAAFAVCSATLMALLPRQLVGLYTVESGIFELAVHFLVWAALFQIFDGLQATASGVLRGLKDTRGPMVITLIAYWIVGLPFGMGMAFYGGAGPDGLWWGLIAGLAVAAVGLNVRFWRTVRDVRSTNLTA